MHRNRSVVLVMVSALLAISIVSSGSASGTSGFRLDSSFGHNGRARVNIGERLFHGRVHVTDVAPLADGGSIVGAYGDDSDVPFFVARFRSDGSLDSGFGAGGSIKVPFGSHLAAMPSGRFVVVGTVSGRYAGDIRTSRYLPDGTPDRSFNKGGTRVLDLGLHLNDYAGAIGLFPNGALVLGATASCYGTDPGCGYTYAVPYLVRISPGGERLRSVQFSGEFQNELSVLGDGSLLALSTDTAGGYTNVARVTRVRPDGTLDPDFGKRGSGVASLGENVTYTDVADAPAKGFVAGEFGFLTRFDSLGNVIPSFGMDGTARCRPADIHADSTSDSEILALPLGSYLVAGGQGECGLARYDSEGHPDPSFGAGGSLDPSPVLGTKPQAVAVDPGGKIVLAGWDQQAGGIRIARLDAAGEPDPTSAGGFAPFAFGTLDTATDVVALPDGRAVLVGVDRCADGECSDIVLARLRRDGTLDPSFGRRGLAAAETEGIDSASSVALQPDGKILVGVRVGQTLDHKELKGGTAAILRYRADGTLDPSFGVGGVASVPGEGGRGITAIDVQGNGRIVGVASCGDDCSFEVVRLYRNGRLDPAFAGSGSTTLGTEEIPPEAVVVGGRGRILVAGGRSRLVVARLFANGRTDPSFGRRGIVHQAILRQVRRPTPGKFVRVPVNRGASSLLVTGNRILVGAGVNSKGNGGAVVRLRANGALDRGFGKRGIVQFRGLDVEDMALGRCGQIAVVGRFAPVPGADTFGVASIGRNGGRSRRARVRTPFGKLDSAALGAAVDRRGRVLAAGPAGADFGIARFSQRSCGR